MVGSESKLEKRWSMQDMAPTGGRYHNEPQTQRRSSMMKDSHVGDEEERLEADLEIARRNSRDHAFLQRAS